MMDPWANDNQAVYEFTVSAFAVTPHYGTTKLPVTMILHEIGICFCYSHIARN